MSEHKIVRGPMAPISTRAPMWEVNPPIYGIQPEQPFSGTDLNSKRLDYKWDEDLHIDDIRKYIDETYSSHYSTDKYQATDMIIDAGHGEGFCMGNIMKYAKRYGRKNGYNKKDLLKIIHYAIIMLQLHDLENIKG